MVLSVLKSWPTNFGFSSTTCTCHVARGQVLEACVWSRHRGQGTYTLQKKKSWEEGGSCVNIHRYHHGQMYMERVYCHKWQSLLNCCGSLSPEWCLSTTLLSVNLWTQAFDVVTISFQTTPTNHVLYLLPWERALSSWLCVILREKKIIVNL